MKLTKVSQGLVEIEESSDENSDRMIAKINCPFCSKSIPVAHSSAQLASGRSSKAWWNTSNFDSHLQAHKYSFVDKGNETVKFYPRYAFYAFSCGIFDIRIFSKQLFSM